MMRRPGYRRLIADVEKLGTGPITAIGHSRLVTNGLDAIPGNNQPVVRETLVGIHNGIIVNDASLCKQFGIRRTADVDTEVLLALIEHFRRAGSDLPQATVQAFGQIEGTASVAIVSATDRRLMLATNNGSLYLWRNGVSEDAIYFASEAYILRQFLMRIGRSPQEIDRGMAAIKPGRLVCVDCDTCTVDMLDFDASIDVQPKHSALRPHRHIVNLADKLDPRRVALRRCTRCIMPETMPFISFDDAGVCNYCRTYQSHRPMGLETLRDLVAPYRKANGEPDCVVAVSGGRDSCYGLHVIKRELGLNPVAYTYDWGMITDLARRNQARLCGKLGIEHILVSADIRRKREYIRKNIEAWLKRPSLGMIPLFMAGDKQYFYYAEQTRNHLGVELSFLCENKLERAHFKSGFMGVNEGHNRVFDIGLGKKLALMFYYGKEYVINPRYINASLFDTIGAFYSSYFLDHPQLQLYEYAKWDEAELVRVLRNEYDWELDPETTLTWRIGDGTAPFYNYVYYTVAGFTENDALRSNQIREGVLERATALALVARENEPRWEAMRWYANTVGFSLNDALQTINSMPRLFDRAIDTPDLRFAEAMGT
jgi:asparagine synthetase B (glutamine-hydrolysing)